MFLPHWWHIVEHDLTVVVPSVFRLDAVNDQAAILRDLDALIRWVDVSVPIVD